MKTLNASHLRPIVERVRVSTLLRLIFAVFALGSFVYLWTQTQGELFRALDVHVILLFQLLLLSWPWRTVSLRMVTFCFFLGMGPVSFLVLQITPYLQDLFFSLGINDILGSSWMINVSSGGMLLNIWAPVTEEVLKVLPVILLVLWRRTGLRTQSSPLDLGILAAASGAGFGFAEDLNLIGSPYWRWRWEGVEDISGSLGPFLSPLPFIPVLYYWFSRFMTFSLAPVFYGGWEGGGRGAFSLFPEMIGGDPVIFLGHGTVPLAFGLALGLAIYGARRFKSRWFYLFPLLVLFWDIWEHIMANSWPSYPQLNALSLVATLDLHGRTFTLALMMEWLLATAVAYHILRRYRDAETAFSWRELSYAAYRPHGLLGPLAFLADLLTSLRYGRKTAYGFFHFQNASQKEQERQMFPLFAARVQAYLRVRRLCGQSLPQMPERVQQAIEWAAPAV